MTTIGSFGRPLIVLAFGALLAGCAANAGPGGDPGARPLPSGYSCQSIRGELNKLDSQGTPAKVEAVNQGRKVSPADKAAAERYNQLLNYYLGGRCHV